MGTATNAPPHEAEPTFADCYHVHYGRITAQLTAYLGDAGAAEDVVQEAYLRAWLRWKKISAYDDPAAWIRRVAWNLATSQWRRLIRETKAARRLYIPETAHVVGPENVALVAALRTLRPNHRRVIVLHYLADLAVGDIAVELGVARGTVLSWLHRGRADLAAQLAERREGKS
jgi:RNA polymerase sigma-70 factor, ECF subfamily